MPNKPKSTISGYNNGGIVRRNIKYADKEGLFPKPIAMGAAATGRAQLRAFPSRIKTKPNELQLRGYKKRK